MPEEGVSREALGFLLSPKARSLRQVRLSLSLFLSLSLSLSLALSLAERLALWHSLYVSR